MTAVSRALVTLGLCLPFAAPAYGQEPLQLQLAEGPSSSLPAAAPTDLALEEQATIRHSQLQWHQAFALATLGSMALTTGVGAYTTNAAGPAQYATMRSLHLAMGGLTTGLYLGAATLAVTSPTGYEAGSDGLDSVSLHRTLGWLHAAGIGTTVAMGLLTAIGRLDASTHGLVGGTTLGLMALSAGVIAFEF